MSEPSICRHLAATGTTNRYHCKACNIEMCGRCAAGHIDKMHSQILEFQKTMDTLMNAPLGRTVPSHVEP